MTSGRPPSGPLPFQAKTDAHHRTFRTKFNSDLFEVKGVSAAVAAFLEGVEKADDVQIVLHEAINNIVEHGHVNRFPSRVLLSIRESYGHVKIRLIDHGIGYPDGQVPAGIFPELPENKSQIPEGGFGWAIIRALSGDIAYARRLGANALEISVSPDPS